MVHIQDSELLIELKRLRDVERAAVADLLVCLREVDRRELYLSKGFSSLYEFCLVELGYNKDEAYYRISAMRLLKDAPQLEKQIREGKLSLTAAAKAQIAFRREDRKRKELNQAPLEIRKKSEVLDELALCSKRETEKTLARHFPQETPPELTRPISETRTLVQFSASQELMDKLEKLKNLTAHTNYDGGWEALFSRLADLALGKLTPKAPKSLARMPTAPHPIDQRIHTKKPEPLAFVPARKHRPYISVEIKRRLWHRAEGQCEFVDTQSGRRCQSRHALELDHKWPKALGGEDREENLRWLCRPHNAHAAQEVFEVS